MISTFALTRALGERLSFPLTGGGGGGGAPVTVSFDGGSASVSKSITEAWQPGKPIALLTATGFGDGDSLSHFEIATDASHLFLCDPQDSPANT